MSARGDDTGERDLRALYDAHAAALLGYAVRLCAGDRARAEDVVQETLVRAWRHLDQLDPDAAPVRPWLFTVAHRVAIDAHRARRARPPEVPDTGLASVPALDELSVALDRIVVTDALGSLSAEHRAVIVETYYRGRTVGEAAATLGVPVGTVKSRCYYALRALKLALAERGVTT
ncbi:sigma-70 family RNA polymerase sigma factor [Geodermatophilus sabuli]|uniref:RNA polymerase sigma factor n=1 Tax=Geodermatophilus sabuli TaxID=1564158 RepID=A0A7K3W579_9ACTN|nr:sigma-70 family RNA polymerase sigma factor [Geodermatophilus sabuli]NEK58987.1 sigma-70 family RNA polymerase sigma factor [Geodermatophilus sabuli]